MMNTISILKKVIISITYFSLCFILQYDCTVLNIVSFSLNLEDKTFYRASGDLPSF